MIQLPPNNSKFWNIAMFAVAGATAAGLLSVLYANGFDPMKDSATVIGILGAMGFVQIVKAFFAGDGK